MGVRPPGDVLNLARVSRAGGGWRRRRSRTQLSMLELRRRAPRRLVACKRIVQTQYTRPGPA